jgi:hypothetical protein
MDSRTPRAIRERLDAVCDRPIERLMSYVSRFRSSLTYFNALVALRSTVQAEARTHQA